MNWLRRFMYGRNGVDQLALACLALGLLLSIAAQLLRLPLLSGALYALSWLCMFFVFFRILSRNVNRRKGENARFLGIFGVVRGWVRLRCQMVRDLRAYKYLKCPQCRQRIRAPRGKGRIVITCQRCSERFERTV